MTSLSEYSARSGLTVSQTLKRIEQQKQESELQQINSRISKSKLQNVQLPNIPKQIETYDPRLGLYISTSPQDQFGTSIVTRSPTMEESKRISGTQRRGSYRYISNVVERKVVSPILKYISPITKKIRKIPIVGGVGDSPKITFGEGILIAKETSQQVADISKEGWLDISKKLGEKAIQTNKGIYKNILTSAKDYSKGISYVVKESPTIIQYTTLPLVGATSIDLLAVEEKKGI